MQPDHQDESEGDANEYVHDDFVVPDEEAEGEQSAASSGEGSSSDDQRKKRRRIKRTDVAEIREELDQLVSEISEVKGLGRLELRALFCS